MNRPGANLVLVLLPLILLGCGGPNMRAVHEGPLLDDKVLQDRVESALARAGSDFKNVHATSDNATVSLTGTVSSVDARAKAEEISAGVYGVVKTDNELKVNEASSSP